MGSWNAESTTTPSIMLSLWEQKLPECELLRRLAPLASAIDRFATPPLLAVGLLGNVALAILFTRHRSLVAANTFAVHLAAFAIACAFCSRSRLSLSLSLS